MDPTRIIVMYGHKEIRRQIGDFLSVAGMNIVQNVGTVLELQENVCRWKPHIILLNIRQMEDEMAVSLKNLKQTIPPAKSLCEIMWIERCCGARLQERNRRNHRSDTVPKGF